LDGTSSEQLSSDLYWDFQELSAKDLSKMVFLTALTASALISSLWVWNRGFIEVMGYLLVLAISCLRQKDAPQKSLLVFKSLEVSLLNFKAVHSLGLQKYLV
jgi:hypothetical protein